MVKEAREQAEDVMNEKKRGLHIDPHIKKDKLMDTLKRKPGKEEQFIALKKIDSENEKMNKEAVQRAHSARQCKKKGECFEKHI